MANASSPTCSTAPIPAYAGWRWAVTVVRAPRSKVVTVSETVLLPGPGALLAPDWVPWQDRLRPGDLGVGDLLPAPPDDERLVPLVVLEGDDAVTDWFGGDADEGDLGSRRAGRTARTRTVARAVRHRPGGRVRALVRQRARPAVADRARGARPLRQLRLLRPAERGARPPLRRLRERVRAGRRPGRVGRSRLRGSFGGHGRRGGRARAWRRSSTSSATTSSTCPGSRSRRPCSSRCPAGPTDPRSAPLP